MFSTKFRITIFKAFCVIWVAIFATTILSQVPAPTRPSQEVSKADGIPVLIKHLPDWEKVRSSTVFTTNRSDLKIALAERQILDLIDFTTGTEAVTAQYDAGRLLIVEYTSPQVSADADNKFRSALSESGDLNTVYRRIGNYNAFVFDVTDERGANALLDQIKYEKEIQWLGDNPFRISAERAFVLTTSDIFFSTVFVILIGMGISIAGGLIAGVVYFQFRERRRAAMPTFTDAGGMTRLNLDGFTPDIQPERLLGE